MTDPYFVLETENNSSYPLFSSDEDRGGQLGRGEPVDLLDGPFRLRLGDPIPKAPKFVDLHVMPNPVISIRLHAALEPLNLHKVQYVPAVVPHKGELHTFYIMHVMNRISAIDLAKSQYTKLPSGRISILEKIVLDEAKLKELRLDERLVFLAKEHTSVWFFHQSVKERIEAIEPVGVRFFAVNQWDDTVAFK